MFKLDFSSKALEAKLKEAGDQLPYAVSLALNDLAFQGRKAERSYLSRVLDAPLPFTLNGVLYSKATKRDLRAYIYLRDEVARYMEPQIEGGKRNAKGLEVGLQSRSWRGGVLPRDTYFIPTKAFQTGRGGNITKGKARKILQETKRRDGKFFLFVDNADGRPYVMERRASGIRLALIGVSKPMYKKRVDFHEVLERLVAQSYDKALHKALDRVLPTSDR